MSDLQVPDFNTLDDFKNWVKKLKDKEIQAWTTKDWLKVYEKIDAYIVSPDFDRIFKERIPQLIKNEIFIGTAEGVINHPDVNSFKRAAFIEGDEEVRCLLGDLYSNYRFEEEQLKVIRRLGKEAGTELAKNEGIDLASLAIRTRQKTTDELLKVMALSNDIIINQTNYKNSSNEYYRNLFSFEVNDKIDVSGRAVTCVDDDKSKLIMNSKKIGDSSVQTSFHEAAHLHLQNKLSIQRTLLTSSNIPAISELGEDFHKLMEKNKDYYVNPLSSKQIEDNRQYYNFKDEKEIKKELKHDYNRYHKQPRERYSEIYSIEAERAFRSTTGQYSERNAIKVNDILRDKTYLGHPQKVHIDESGGINIIYKPDAEDIEEIFTKQLPEVDKDIIKNINITQNADGTIKVHVSKDISLTKALNNYIERKNLRVPNKAFTTVFVPPENMQTTPHKFPSVADIKGMEKIDLYHGSRNFFEKYDLTKARTVGGALYGLGQYFTPKESMAYGYATLDKETPFIENSLETNGERVATQKVIYHGELSGDDLKNIIVPEKMTDLDYDVLIKTAEKQRKSDIVAELTKIKATSADRHIDLCQWLRKTENVQFMQSAGINGIYSPDREIYAIYDTSKMNIKVKEAVVLSGTEIPKNLIADKSIIHIQETLVDKAESAHILTTEGHALQKDGTSGGKTIIATAEKSVEKQAEQAVTSATEKVATKSAMKATAVQAGAKVAKTAKTAGKVTKETLLAVNKAYDDTFDAIMKWGDKHAPQWMNHVEEATVQKAAEKFMKTKSGQAIAKQIEKKVGKEVAASIAKKIPILCLGVGAVCVYDRVKEGEYLKAVGEGASALVANVPGLGTLASFGLDGAMLSDDLKVFEHGVMPKDPNSHMAAESTFVARQIVAEKKFVRKVDKAAEAKKKAEEEKKKAESKKKAQEFEKNLYKYSGKQADFFER